MSVRFCIFVLSVVVLAASLSVKEALADTEGISGRLVGLQVVDTGSNTFSKFRGSIFVKESSGIVQEYKWGGTTCTGQISIVDSDIANFSRQLNSRLSVRIIPIYKNGQGGSRCIKRYIMVIKSFENDIIYTID